MKEINIFGSPLENPLSLHSLSLFVIGLSPQNNKGCKKLRNDIPDGLHKVSIISWILMYSLNEFCETKLLI
jgi:hypothetical protein